MTMTPSVREVKRGIASDYANAFNVLCAYLQALVVRERPEYTGELRRLFDEHPCVQTYAEYVADRPWGNHPVQRTPERDALDTRVAWFNAQLRTGALHTDRAAAEQLDGFVVALTQFIKGAGDAPDFPIARGTSAQESSPS